MSFAIVIEGMTLIVYFIILAGGKQKRESGWKVLAGLHVIVAALQVAAMAIIVSLIFAHWWVEAYDFLNRHTSMITTIASSLAGSWILHGSIALSAGAFSFSWPAVSAQRRYGYRSKADTNSYLMTSLERWNDGWDMQHDDIPGIGGTINLFTPLLIRVEDSRAESSHKSPCMNRWAVMILTCELCNIPACVCSCRFYS